MAIVVTWSLWYDLYCKYRSIMFQIDCTMVFLFILIRRSHPLPNGDPVPLRRCGSCYMFHSDPYHSKSFCGGAALRHTYYLYGCDNFLHLADMYIEGWSFQRIEPQTSHSPTSLPLFHQRRCISRWMLHLALKSTTNCCISAGGWLYPAPVRGSIAVFPWSRQMDCAWVPCAPSTTNLVISRPRRAATHVVIPPKAGDDGVLWSW